MNNPESFPAKEESFEQFVKRLSKILQIGITDLENRFFKNEISEEEQFLESIYLHAWYESKLKDAKKFFNKRLTKDTVIHDWKRAPIMLQIAQG